MDGKEVKTSANDQENRFRFIKNEADQLTWKNCKTKAPLLLDEMRKTPFLINQPGSSRENIIFTQLTKSRFLTERDFFAFKERLNQFILMQAEKYHVKLSKDPAEEIIKFVSYDNRAVLFKKRKPTLRATPKSEKIERKSSHRPHHRRTLPVY